ncbi:uncharacterized protein Pyn_16765 [Prunus yedoensis var. nudiflora]|uniref:DUF4220 domain-containing protein n=2 Tax=Prunus yedoensis var. nudiflora TaxID=2094558 RepID=A0A314UNY9_PRUYE|nr:uncharacterized protein Pyn_16765 [Prunus yedoensis var. nudiflora]
MTEIFPESLSKLWSLWEIRVMVILSLILQGILIVFGNKRKYSTSKWLRLLWLAYLSADWVATVSLSLLSKNLSSTNHNMNSANADDQDQILTAFWAPFLLLHLGGPDTITAYSLEDNELWWRHLLVLLVQVSLAVYVFLTAWAGQALNLLAIPVFVAGIIKFAERTWVLRSASSKHFRDSMFRRPDPGPDYARYTDELRSKKHEGFKVDIERVDEAPTIGDFSFTAPSIFPNTANLQHANVFFNIFKRLFADLILSIHDILKSKSFFQNRSYYEAFKVIEIELGFMYDLFYTKAVLYSLNGAILRFTSFVSIISVSVTFLVMIEKQDYSAPSIIITYVLLAGAIILELYAVILFLRSDWAVLWFCKHKIAAHLLYPVISHMPLAENKRWSNVITQYNLISICCEAKRAKYRFLEKVSRICRKSKKPVEVRRELKELIYLQLLKKSTCAPNAEGYKKLRDRRMDWVLQNEKCIEKLGWSIGEEFDLSVLLWHIATQLCYYSDQEKYPNSFPDPNCEASKLLSEYMLYLLVKRPFMLPNGIGQIRFKDTCAEATEFFKQRRCQRSEPDRACKKLREVNSDEILPAEVKGDESKSVLFDACKLAKDLESLETKENWENQKKWELISHVWVEMLSSAASHCRWNHHAAQLRHGGELLTHVWLLMAHLGLTEQLQTFELQKAIVLNVR